MSNTAAVGTDEAAARARLRARPPATVLVPLVTVVAVATLVTTWLQREQRYLSPDRGLGYALGILGLSAMLLLLLYPARKRGWIPGFGPIRTWFHVHMALGIIGPTLVLIHSNFELGSLNSSVALGSALIVGSSGYIGRFAYSRIHFGLTGQRTRFADLRERLELHRGRLGGGGEALDERLAILEQWATAAQTSALAALTRYLASGPRIARVRSLASRTRLDVATRSALDDYLAAAQQLARFSAYERLFGLWHALHVPLCFFLFSAAFVHLVAVHLY